MKTIIFLIQILLILISACKETPEYGIVSNDSISKFNNFPKEEKISFVNMFDYKEGVPRSIHTYDSMLIITNSSRHSEYFFYTYSLIDKKLSEGFLRKGRGPGEAIGVSTSGIYKNMLWAYGVTLKKILITNVESLLKTTESISFDEYKVTQQYFKMTLSDSLHIIAISQFNNENNKLDVVNLLTGEKTNEIGTFYKIPERLNVQAVKDAYSGEIIIRPAGNKVALARNYSDLLEIYDLTTNKHRAIQGPDVFDVAFVQKRRKDHYYMGTIKETRSAFINITATNQYIYLLYSGHIRKNHSKEDMNKWVNGKYIFIYDWDGKPIKKLVLDKYIFSIGVSKDNKTIYSYDNNNGHIIKAGINWVDEK